MASDHGVMAAPSLPVAGFIQLRIKATALIRVRPGRSLLFEAAFRSPAARVILRSSPAARSMFPACVFKAILEASLDPFGDVLPSHLRFCFASGAVQRTKPVAQSYFQNSLPAFGLSLPSRIFRILRDRNARPDSSSKAYHCESPDLPLLPAAPKQLLIRGTTDRCSGSATPARLSLSPTPGRCPAGARPRS